MLALLFLVANLHATPQIEFPTEAHRFLPRLKGELEFMAITNNPLWPIENQWSIEAEKAYNQWVAKEVTADLLKDSGVTVDCADAAITIRWIYAHDHHLPAAATLPNEHVLGSWQSTEAWDQLASDSDWRADKRFKAALRYVLNLAYTHTVVIDTYPVAINTDYVGPGTVLLSLFGATGHTRTLYGLNNCLQTYYGNEPASSQIFVGCEAPQYQRRGVGGLLRWRWPEQDAQGAWSLRAPEQMPGYSLDQYNWTEDEFVYNANINLGLAKTPVDIYKLIAQSLISGNAVRLSLPPSAAALRGLT